VLDCRLNLSWSLTSVYGPQGELDKQMFNTELKGIKHKVKPHWLLIGDYNLIYKAQDKNKGRLNYLEVKELDLIGRKFTWSNNQAALTHQDRPSFLHSTYGDLISKPSSATSIIFYFRPLPSITAAFNPPPPPKALSIFIFGSFLA
jgi:hypothetical protein